ncbi:hypothetical protein [Clostridium carnis]
MDFESFLKNCDAAMDIAKSNGKSQYQIFNYNISYELNKIYSIQKGLRTALDDFGTVYSSFKSFN